MVEAGAERSGQGPARTRRSDRTALTARYLDDPFRGRLTCPGASRGPAIRPRFISNEQPARRQGAPEPTTIPGRR